MKNRSILISAALIALVLALFGLVTPGAMAQGPAPRAPRALAGTAFTYQGRLIRNNQPISETCALSLSLWDAASAGSFLNSNTLSSVAINTGLFTVVLDFGSAVYNGQALYLETAVKCASDPNYVTLLPRTQLRPAPYALYAINNWALNGNSGTGGTGFVGTTDNTALTIGVNGTGALRIYPQSTSPNIVGGYSGNVISPTLYGQTIAGGGSFFYENRTLREYGTVGGGRNNHSDGYGSTIPGGIDNQAANDYATVAGGLHNYATGSSSGIGGGFYNVASGYVAYIGGGDLNWATTQNATVSGGYSNTVTGGQLIANNTIGGGVFNFNSGFAATIAGGHGNQATGEWSSMGGGGFNAASGRSATVSGGEYNLASGAGATIGGGGWNGFSTSGNQAKGAASMIGGGYGNLITADGGYGTIGGGQQNQITAALGSNLNIATIGGGFNNKVTLGGGTIGGGNSNTVSNFDATVGGGYGNVASGGAATVPGGNSNLAQGAYSLAAGYRAKSLVDGTFCWGDSTNADLNCSTPNSFVTRSSGGVSFYTNSSLTSGITIAAGANAWSPLSDRNSKENFSTVDVRAIVEKLAQIPISTWNYKTQDVSIRHIGPMAQDLYAAFAVGEDNTHISTIDADGVSLAAIQGLYQMAQDKDAQIASQQKQINALETRLAMLEQQVANANANPTSNSQPVMLGLGALGLLGIVYRERHTHRSGR